LETGSLTVELTPLDYVVILSEALFASRRTWRAARGVRAFCGRNNRAYRVLPYFTSLCGVCFRQRLQNFFISIRSGVVFRFFVVE
jgi:hypothetical protein